MFKSVNANKTLRTIVSFVFNTVQFVIAKDLGKEEDFCHEDLQNASLENPSTSECGVPSSNVTNDETPRSINRDDEIS